MRRKGGGRMGTGWLAVASVAVGTGVAWAGPMDRDAVRYDPESRRGMAEMPIAAEMAPSDMKALIRGRIESKIAENGVSSGVGGGGACYRILSESLEGGVLAVEFEVLE